jgi:protein polybromo-1
MDDEEKAEEEEEAEAEEEEEKNGTMPFSKVEKCKEILQKARDLKVKGRLVSELFELLPTRKQMPDYYRQIANPVDFKSIAASLKKANGYGSVWDFLISVELMFSNAQVYNEKESQIFKDAETMRKTIRTALEKTFPGHPYPEPMSVYEKDQCVEPDWRSKKKLSVKMSGKGKGSSLKVTLQASVKCGACVHCLEPSRKKRCLDAQMREQARDGHEGAKIAIEGKKATGVSIEIYWPPEKTFYKGKIVAYDPKTCSHEIRYDNGDTEQMELWRKEEQVKRAKK